MFVQKDLNEQQWEAVTAIQGPILVLAGAGSGKTRVVTYRIAYLIQQGVAPDQILAVTFTNKAAQQMKERVQKMTQHSVWISTFHSLGARILRESIHFLGYQPHFLIYDEEDSLKLLRSVLAELKLTDRAIEPRAVRSLISFVKNETQSFDQLAIPKRKNPLGGAFQEVYRLYQERLKQANALDFDDLLFLVLRLFREFPDVLASYQVRFSHLLVDEYQDTNAAQHQLIDWLVARSRNICVVGDPDQSIYSWRGAKVGNILQFPRDYPDAKTIRLEQNYRSTENILQAANGLIHHNRNRLEKDLWSQRGGGVPVLLYTAENEEEETEYVASKVLAFANELRIPLQEMAVFYRTNAQSRVFEDTLLRHDIPYVIIGGISFYQRKEIKDLLAFLRMALSDTDFISFSRTIHLPRRGIGPATMEKIRIGAQDRGGSLLDFCQKLVQEGGVLGMSFTKKQKAAVQEYLEKIQLLRRLAQESSLKELVSAAIEETGYLTVLEEEPETYQDRKENLDALLAKATEWEEQQVEPTLQGFLEELSLKTDVGKQEESVDRLNLMTIHNSKGLEFRIVFLVGLEEFLFPHANAQDDEEAIEEERRLCYVGMTRAQEQLIVSHARFRFLWGTRREQYPSRFLREIPNAYLEKVRHRHSQSFRRPPSPSSPANLRLSLRLKPSLRFQEGDTIFHPEFGIGVVRSVSDSSVGTICEILFSKDQAVKKLVAEHSSITKL